MFNKNTAMKTYGEPVRGSVSR